MTVNIIIIDGDEKDRKKKLRDLLPDSMRDTFKQANIGVEMEDGETLRKGLPKGFDSRFVVPEEVLFFPSTGVSRRKKFQGNLAKRQLKQIKPPKQGKK